MSFRSTEGSQHRDAGAAATKQAAYVAQHADGSLIFDSTGPADRTIYSDESGAIRFGGGAVPISLSASGEISFDDATNPAAVVESGGAWTVSTTGAAGAYFTRDEDGALRIWTVEKRTLFVGDGRVTFTTL